MPSIRLTTVDPRELGRSWPRIFTRSNRVIRIGDFFFRFESQEIEKANYENESGRNWIRGGVLSSLSFVSELFIDFFRRDRWSGDFREEGAKDS